MSSILYSITKIDKDRMITEQRTYKLWENAGRKIVEAQLTANQINQLFANIEQSATAAGGNRTAIGKGKDAATAVNKAWEELKTKVQNSGPIKNMDAYYDQAAEKLKQATGGDQGVMKYVQKYRDFAKKHPVAQSLIYSALIAAAGITGAGVGGAAALGLFKMVDKLLQGEKFSSAAYSGAKTGALAYGASKVGDLVRGQSSTAADAADAADTAKTAKDTAQGVRKAAQAVKAVKPYKAYINGELVDITKTPEYLQMVKDGIPNRYAIDLTMAKLNTAPTAESIELSEQQIQKLFSAITLLNEGLWDTIKGKAQQVGKNITTKITADKLQSAWQKAGSPTDSSQIAALLLKNGVSQQIIDAVFKQMKIQATPAQKPKAQPQQPAAQPKQAAPRTAAPRPAAPAQQANKPVAGVRQQGGTFAYNPLAEEIVENLLKTYGDQLGLDENNKAEIRAELDQAIRDFLAKGGEIKQGKVGGPTTRKQQIRSLVKNLGSSHIGKRGESPRGDKVGKGANLKGSAVAKLSGGMSAVKEIYNPLDDERREQEKMDQEKRDFKRKELDWELRNEPKNNYEVVINGKVWKVFADKQKAENIARSLQRKGVDAKVYLTGARATAEGVAPPKAGFNPKPKQKGSGGSPDDYEYTEFVPRGKEDSEAWAIKRTVVKQKLPAKKQKELDTGFYKSYLGNRPFREGGMAEALDSSAEDFMHRLKQGTLKQNPKGSAAEKQILNRYLATPMVQDFNLPAKEWIYQATNWLQGVKKDLQKKYPDADLSDLEELAHRMYEDYLARMGKLEEEGKVKQGEPTDNFTIDDIHELEKIKDFDKLKAKAKWLIKGKPARRMKQEKIAYFYDRVDTLTSPMKVIKMMYDLLLAGEGHKTIGSWHSMDPNHYAKAFSKLEETHSTGTTIGSAGIGGGAGLGIESSPTTKILQNKLDEFVDTSGGGDDNDELRDRVIEMYYEDGLRETEIARIEGIPEELVHRIIDRHERGLNEGEVVSLQARKIAKQFPIVFATSRLGTVNDVDLIFKDLRTNKIVAHVIGRNDRPVEINGKKVGGALYEIRINNQGLKSAGGPISYLATGNPNHDDDKGKYMIYTLKPSDKKIEKSPGPGGTTKLRPDRDDVMKYMVTSGTYYGYDLIPESNDDWYTFLEKALHGKIMDQDLAVELGYVYSMYNGELVFVQQPQRIDGKEIKIPQEDWEKQGIESPYEPRTPDLRHFKLDDVKETIQSSQGGMGQAYRKVNTKAPLNEYSVVDNVIQVLPAGLDVSQFYAKAYPEYLFNLYNKAERQNFLSVAKGWYDEYKKKHNMKEYSEKRAPMLIKDIDRIEDLLYTLPKGLDFNKFIDVALKQYINHKYGTKHWDEWKNKLRYQYWDAYQKAGKDKPQGMIGKVKSWFKEEQAPMFTPEDEAKMVNANDPGSDGWKIYGTKESAVLKGIQEYDVEKTRKIEFSKENPPRLDYLYRQFLHAMLSSSNNVEPNEWIKNQNDRYGLNYTWKDYQNLGHKDYTNNWDKIVQKYILNKK